MIQIDRVLRETRVAFPNTVATRRATCGPHDAGDAGVSPESGSGADQVLELFERLVFEQVTARFDAHAADLLADSAVTVMLSVPRALLGAVLARSDAGLEQSVDDQLVPLRRPRENSRRHVAHVRAVGAQRGADA